MENLDFLKELGMTSSASDSGSPGLKEYSEYRDDDIFIMDDEDSCNLAEAIYSQVTNPTDLSPINSQGLQMLMDYGEEDDDDESDSLSFSIDWPIDSPTLEIEKEIDEEGEEKDVKDSKRCSRPRKRLPRPEMWKKNIQKRLKNSGDRYTTRSGHIVEKKTMKAGCPDMCRRKCSERISSIDREKNFEAYYACGNSAEKWQFIFNHCKRENVKCAKTSGPNRQYSAKFYLTAFSKNDGAGSLVQVCSRMFLQTLDITQQIVRTAFKKFDPSALSSFADKRGTFKRKMTEDDVALKESIVTHIKSFPTIDSHYIRKDSVKTYLENDLSLAKMHRLYIDFAKENYPDLKPAAEWKYREIFNHEFNIGFHQPKKDQCAECEAYKNSTEEEMSVRSNEYNAHLSNKIRARELKEADKTKAINDEKVCTAVFDFQKLLYCPISEANVFYYKRKLAIINFTVFDMGATKGTCYVWNETQGKRGGNEVASCLLKFITDACEAGVQQFLFWSDNCIGQNKNQILFSMYCWIVKRFKISITHRFLEKGHTQNEGDSVHALIERVSRNKTIYSPEEWYSIIRNAKTTNKYKVVQMDVFDFLDFRKIKHILSAKKNAEGGTVKWTQIREVCVSSENPDIFTYKYIYDEDPQLISLSTPEKKGRPRKNISPISPENLPPPVRTEPWPLQKNKYQDLQFFCSGNYIPKSVHSFYNSLPYGDTAKIEEDSD